MCFFAPFPMNLIPHIFIWNICFGLVKFVKKKHKHAKVIDLLSNFRLNSLYCLAGVG